MNLYASNLHSTSESLLENIHSQIPDVQDIWWPWKNYMNKPFGAYYLILGIWSNQILENNQCFAQDSGLSLAKI